MTCFLIDDDLDDQEFFTIALETIDNYDGPDYVYPEFTYKRICECHE
jgi:hypothetical protein